LKSGVPPLCWIKLLRKANMLVYFHQACYYAWVDYLKKKKVTGTASDLL
jgi:hypothetical protein